jgi:hypothetical protein
VRRLLSIAATNGPIVHSLSDIWAWITMVEWCCQRKTAESSTRASLQSYYRSHLMGSRRNVRKKWEFGLAKYFCKWYTCKWFLHAQKSYDMLVPALLPLRRQVCCGFLSFLNIHRDRPDLNPRTLDLMASILTITPLRQLIILLSLFVTFVSKAIPFTIFWRIRLMTFLLKYKFC